jgi:hypothetical protein
MTRDAYTAALEQHLRTQGCAFDRAAVLAFVASCWPLIEDDPDVTEWARRFAEAGLAGAR